MSDLSTVKRDAVAEVLARHLHLGDHQMRASLSVLILDAIDRAVDAARLAKIVRPAAESEDEYDNLSDAVLCLGIEIPSVFAFLQGPQRTPLWAVAHGIDCEGDGYVTDIETEVFESASEAESWLAAMKVGA
jgi:hypothetical protein